VLISRKCKHQSGTRFHHRGINDEGFVANFVMTENIIFVEDLGLSVVTYRGSVPTFWKQKSVGDKVKITRD
jgi:phosphatidylinositol-bisphosphatase